MPIYTYGCKSCGGQIERRQSFSDAPLSVCESCGGPLRRLLHPVGVIFKGSGFYNTDYRKTANGSSTSEASESIAAPTDAAGPKPTPAPAAPKTEAAPAAAAPAPTKPAE